MRNLTEQLRVASVRLRPAFRTPDIYVWGWFSKPTKVLEL